MLRSHKISAKPSVLVAAICCAVIYRIRPQWLAISVSDAAAEAQCKPGHISRLATRAIGRFESIVRRLTSIGRPTHATRKSQDATNAANKLNNELLAVAAELLANVPWGRRPALRALLVGAYQRLRENHPELTQKHFCTTVGLSERTLRHWLKNPPHDNLKAAPPAPQPKQPRPLRRGRFRFDVTIPDTQIATDTTDITAFGVPLKLVATQDVGGRDQDLLESIIVDDHESAEHVVDALTDAIAQRGGMQVICDQGTPYMADATREALDGLDVEHAPQREGTPTAKATIERAFGSVKTIAGPLLEISNRVAASFHSLKDPHFAKSATTLLLTALLRAYQAGARASCRADVQRGTVSAEDLAHVAQEAREQARAEHISVRQTLTRIHAAYDMNMPLQKFIRTHRRYSPDVIHEAERLFAKQAHRDDIRNRSSYFAALLRTVNQPHAARRRKMAEQHERERAAERDRQVCQNQDAHFRDNPTAWLRDAFNKLLLFWMPDKNDFLFGGIGPARAHLAGALKQLCTLHDVPAVLDIANGVLADFDVEAGYDACALRAIHRHVQCLLPTTTKVPAGKFDDFGSYAIFATQGPRARPPPPILLRT
jgi:hypothetical protein